MICTLLSERFVSDASGLELVSHNPTRHIVSIETAVDTGKLLMVIPDDASWWHVDNVAVVF